MAEDDEDDEEFVLGDSNFMEEATLRGLMQKVKERYT